MTSKNKATDKTNDQQATDEQTTKQRMADENARANRASHPTEGASNVHPTSRVGGDAGDDSNPTPDLTDQERRAREADRGSDKASGKIPNFSQTEPLSDDERRQAQQQGQVAPAGTTGSAPAPPTEDDSPEVQAARAAVADDPFGEQAPPFQPGPEPSLAGVPTSTQPGAPASATPSIERVIAVVQHQIVNVDGVPEQEFARDLAIPIEARERLITACGQELFGKSPTGDALVNLAAEITTVGKLLDVLAVSSQQHEQAAPQGGRPFVAASQRGETNAAGGRTTPTQAGNPGADTRGTDARGNPGNPSNPSGNSGTTVTGNPGTNPGASQGQQNRPV